MTAKENAKSLMTEMDEINRKIAENYLVLETNNCTMNTPLVDAEGYPIATIDVYAVRHARHNIICLENDRKDLDKRLHEALETAHEASKNENKIESEEEKPVHRTSNTPFAKVTSVIPDSPAGTDGIKKGDLIIQYGNLHFGNFTEIKQVAEITAKNEGKVIRVTVIRNMHPVRIELRPRKWNGNGLLGCTISPEKSEAI